MSARGQANGNRPLSEMEARMRNDDSGFTLLELLIAMVLTLMVSGAIYGLIDGGQVAFRREPDMTDRQQNIRMAMDMIMRDVSNAGFGQPPSGSSVAMPPFMQVFTQGLTDDNGTHDSDSGAPLRPDSTTTHADELELMVSPDEPDNEAVCGYNSGSASNIRTVNNTTRVQSGGIALVIMADGTWTIRQVVSTFGNNGGPGTCTNGDPHADLSFRSGNNGDNTSNVNVPGGLCQPAAGGIGTAHSGCDPRMISSANLVTYRIRTDPDGVPVLQRRSTATLNGADFATTFTTVARGIEDMQVSYAQASDPKTFRSDFASGTRTGAPAVVNGNYGTITTQVRVVLKARGTAQRLAGQAIQKTGDTGYIRGSLVSTAMVRSSTLVLAASPTPMWN